MACTRVIQCEVLMFCTAVAPDGLLLAAGLWGGGVLLLDALSGARHMRLTSEQANSVAFLHTSTSPLLAAGLNDSTVQVWDCSSGACVATMRSHRDCVHCVAFSPDGRLLASASEDKTVRLWRTDDWHAPPAVLRGHSNWVNGVSFSCDSRLLASCSEDQTVRLWHIPDWGTAADAPDPTAAAGPVLEVDRWVYCVAFSPVDSMLMACGGGWPYFIGLARVGADDGAITVEHELQGHTDDVRSLAFSPCGQRLASASGDSTVRLWSVTSGACLRVLRGHTGDIIAVQFFPNSKQLASSSDDNTVRIWTLCAWSDQTHHLFGAPLKAAVFTLMCVRARLEQEQEQGRGGQHALQLPRLPMEVWLLVFGQLQLALEADVGDVEEEEEYDD